MAIIYLQIILILNTKIQIRINQDKSVFKSHQTLVKINNRSNLPNSYQSNIKQKCKRCLNHGHNHLQCKTNLSYKCAECGKFGHTTDSCKYRNNIQTHNVRSDLANNTDTTYNKFEQFLNMITPLINTNTTTASANNIKSIEQGNHLQSNNTRPIRTITFNQSTKE